MTERERMLEAMGIRSKAMIDAERKALKEFKADKRRREAEIVLLPKAVEHGAARFEVTMPNFRPQSLSTLMHIHFRKAAKLKDREKAVISQALAKAGVTGAIGRRRLHMIIQLGPRQRMFDDDNPWKGLKDALKTCGAIFADTRFGVQHSMEPEYSPIRGEVPSTTIILEDIEALEWVSPKPAKKPRKGKGDAKRGE